MPPPPVVVEPTATPALGPSEACKDAKKEVEEMQLALESTKKQLMLLNEDIKLKQAEWEKNKKPVDILKDKILMTKKLYQRALERVLRVGPKWEDILHVYQSSGVAWSRWVTRYPKLGEWIRTVQKFEDLLFDLYKDVASLLAAQNVLARDLINKKEISKTTLREVNRLSNILKRLLDKMQLACR